MADIVFPGQSTAGDALNAGAMPANNDMVIYKGNFVELYVTVKDSTGTAISLVGSTPKAQLKVDYYDKSPTDFNCTLTGTAGQVRIFLSTAVTQNLVPGSYIWDFQITNSLGETRTYLAGDVTVINEVTNG